MDSTQWIVLVVVAVVVIGALLYFATRKKALPAPPPSDVEKPAAPAAKEKAKAPAAEAKPPSRKAPIPAESLPSTDVLPAEESIPPQRAAVPSGRPPRRGDVAGLRKGLAATRGGFIAKLSALFGGRKEIDPAILEQIEEVMIASDVGVKTTQSILERLRDRLNKNELGDADAVWAALRTEAVRILSVDGMAGGPIRFPAKPAVVLMVGVNGVGKTTTIGKLATKYNAENKKVMLAAGDTFRAAAVQQLMVWGNRVGAEVVKGKEGADPGAVAFDATNKAKESGVDLLLVDTAGRLHTKAPLMDEIKKVRKTIAKAMEGAPHETLLVLDATTGQNALNQAAQFKEALDLTGVILTKLDGTAKGGIVLAVSDTLKLPVRYIGLGERAEDLRAFDPEDFAEALFGSGDDTREAA